jgi:hypothetical protein
MNNFPTSYCKTIFPYLLAPLLSLTFVLITMANAALSCIWLTLRAGIITIVPWQHTKGGMQGNGKAVS